MEKIFVVDCDFACGERIAKCVREFKVLAETVSADEVFERSKHCDLKGIIITASESNEVFSLPENIFAAGVPVLGLGAGALIIAKACGGELSTDAFCGRALLSADTACKLLSSLPAKIDCGFSLSQTIDRVPTGFRITARAAGAVAAMENAQRGIYALCFHPENSADTKCVIKNFLYGICGCHAEWTTAAYIRKTAAALKESVGSHRVLCLIDGGPLSTCCALLLHRAVGSNLSCLFINTGLLRKGEGEYVTDIFSAMCGNGFYSYDISDRVFGKLIGISDPAFKEKIIREEFCRAAEQYAGECGSYTYIALPTVLGGERLAVRCGAEGVCEPLLPLFPQEVAGIAKTLGCEGCFAEYEPLSVGGLACRIEGEVTRQKVSLLREADGIVRNGIALSSAGGREKSCTASLSLPSVRTVGGKRTESFTVILSLGGAGLSSDGISNIAEELVKLDGIERICCDITPQKAAL